MFRFRPVLTEQCLREVHQEGNALGMQRGTRLWLRFGLHARCVSFIILLLWVKLLVALALANSVSLSN